MEGKIVGILVRIALNLQVACFAINKFSCFMSMEAFPSYYFFRFCLEYFNTFTIGVFYIPCQVCSQGFFKLVVVNLFPFLSASYLLAFMQATDFYVMVSILLLCSKYLLAPTIFYRMFYIICTELCHLQTDNLISFFLIRNPLLHFSCPHSLAN